MFNLVQGPFGPVFGQANSGAAAPVQTAPTITTTSLPAATVGVAYSAQLAATGNPATFTWLLTSGNKPAWLTVSTGGALSGTPAAGDVTTGLNLTFSCSNGVAPNANSGNLSLVVGAAGTSAVSDPVTTAMTATGAGTTYNVYNDTDMDNVPWGALGAGDVVNIFHKSTPYTRKWGMGRNLDNPGTQANPIVVNGVTDASGNRPKFNWNGATTAKGSNPSLLAAWVAANPSVTPPTKYDCFAAGNIYNLEDYGGVVVYGGYASKPAFIQFKNLEVYGTRGSFTNLQGNTQNYIHATSGFRFQTGKDFLIENCVITDCAWGVYTHISGPTINQTFERLTLRNSRLYGCGNVGANTEHNAYIQCSNPIVEGNYFGKLMPGALGSSYKSRSGGEIFRYNWVEGTPQTRAVDFVEAEEQLDGTTGGLTDAADYGIDHVYGNVIVCDNDLMGSGITNPIHFGGDKNAMQDGIPNPATYDPNARAALYVGHTVNGKKIERRHLFFYNNTVVFSGIGRANFFQLTDSTASVDLWNNIFWAGSKGVSGYLNGFAYMLSPSGGELYYRGSNVVFAAQTPAPAGAIYHGELVGSGSAYIDPTKTSINGQTGLQILAGSVSSADLYDSKRNPAWLGGAIVTDPKLTDILTYDYKPLAGGSAVNAGLTSFPSSLGADFKSLPVQFQPVKRSNGMIARSSLTTIGALQE